MPSDCHTKSPEKDCDVSNLSRIIRSLPRHIKTCNVFWLIFCGDPFDFAPKSADLFRSPVMYDVKSMDWG